MSLDAITTNQILILISAFTAALVSIINAFFAARGQRYTNAKVEEINQKANIAATTAIEAGAKLEAKLDSVQATATAASGETLLSQLHRDRAELLAQNRTLQDTVSTLTAALLASGHPVTLTPAERRKTDPPHGRPPGTPAPPPPPGTPARRSTDVAPIGEAAS